jgi:hypothetical protein
MLSPMLRVYTTIRPLSPAFGVAMVFLAGFSAGPLEAQEFKAPLMVADDTTQTTTMADSVEMGQQTNPSSLGPVQDSADSGNGPKDDSAAVKDITNRPQSFWNDFLDRSSPLHVALDLSETFDDNIFIQPHKTSDYITNVTPGLSFELGSKTSPNSNYVFGLAQFTFLLYEENPRENSDDYFFDAHYRHQFTRLTLGIEQQVRRETLTSIDVGNLIQSDVYATVATAEYDYNDDLSIKGTATQNITDFDSSGYFDTTERFVDLYALYQVLPKLGIGFGPRVGTVQVQGGPNQTYEDALLDLIYRATDKTQITLVTGPEIRQYQGSSAQNITPVVDLSVDYAASDDTTIKFDAHRRRVVSFGSQDEDYVNNEVAASLRQYVFQKVYFTFAGGYDLNDYSGTSAGASDPEREDNYFFVRGGAEWQANDWLDLTAAYQYSRDHSTVSGFSFDDNQVTLSAHMAY